MTPHPDPEELSRIADLCERGSGADRGLDWQVHCRDGLEGVGMYGVHPAYTSSLDAAMTLVPEGSGWIAGWGQTRPDEPMGGATISRNARFAGHGANYDVYAEAEAATPALALTAASLRAHASLSRMGEDR